jgi:hypothetical protein
MLVVNSFVFDEWRIPIEVWRPLGGETRLQFLNFVTSKSTTVARNLGEVSAGLTGTPDGRTISLYSRGLLYRRPDAGRELPVSSARSKIECRGNRVIALAPGSLIEGTAECVKG